MAAPLGSPLAERKGRRADMVKKLSSIVLVFSLALNMAFVGVWSYHRFYLRPRRRRARPRRGRGRFRHRRGDKRHAPRAELALEPRQRRAVHKARRELKKKMGGIGRRIAERREELFELLQQPDPDRKSIKKRVKALNEIRSELTWATVQHILDLKEFLEPEQERRLLEMIRERTDGHGSVLRDFDGRKKCPRSHPECGGDDGRRRGHAPPSRDSHGPDRPGRKR